jgi:hypothetical protein
MLRSLAIAAALALNACATAPTYTPATRQGGPGFSETQIEANRYFVTYRAPSAADQSLVHDYALRRAADITLERGSQWFWVDRRSFDGESYGGGRGASIGFGVGGVRFGGNSAIGTSVGVSVPVGGGGRGQTVRSATLEIRLGEGSKPDDPNAFDAQAVAWNLRPR